MVKTTKKEQSNKGDNMVKTTKSEQLTADKSAIGYKIVYSPKFIPLNDETLYESLLKYVNDNNVELEQIVSEIVFDFLFKRGKVESFNEHYIKANDFSGQTAALMTMLMPYERSMIEQAREANNIPLWQQFLSYVRYALNNGFQYIEFTIPEWKEEMPAKEKVECRNCLQEFVPIRLGQIFCSNKCAVEYGKLA